MRRTCHKIITFISATLLIETDASFLITTCLSYEFNFADVKVSAVLEKRDSINEREGNSGDEAVFPFIERV